MRSASRTTPGSALLDRYVAAFSDYDLEAITELFTEDTVWEMPPFTGWYRGRADIRRLIENHCPATGPGDLRLVVTEANGQPAVANYLRDPADGHYEAFSLQVFTLGAETITHAVVFFDTSLFPHFDLPMTLSAGTSEG